MTIVVTGGAGYIGAHVVRLLVEAGTPVVVVDDLSSGARDRISGAPLVEMDLSEPDVPARLAQVLAEHDATAVIHFAAKKQVGESVEKPLWYYQQNIGGLTNVLSAMEIAGVDRFIFSSSAATYGMPDVPLVREDLVAAPINPYGETKLVGEWVIRAAARARSMAGGELRVAALRYFNVAGAGWSDLGDPTVMNLVPIVLNAVTNGRTPMIFGDDYPTPDGTCIRDYVHVLDLAEAHIAALGYLDKDERPFDVFNVGTGTGSSVRDVIAALAVVMGQPIDAEVAPRRAGDPPKLIGAVDRIHEQFGWTAKYDLPQICASAWDAWNARQA